jgi:phage terminase small subunit
MPRPRTPLAKAKLTGADAKHPDRFKNRSEPRTSKAPVGKPPSYLDAEARAVWSELARDLGWLVKEDRFALEAASLAVGQVRTMHKAQEPITGALFAAMNTALGKLGASPADRSKVNATPPEDDDDPFAKFDPAREYFS